MTRLGWLVAGSTLLAGCAAQRPLYSWGSYEQLIYVAYTAPGKLSPQDEVDMLEKDYQRARAANQRMPPGWHAHLGYRYYELGKPDEAHRELLTEKAEFPESAVFMDRLLANMHRP